MNHFSCAADIDYTELSLTVCGECVTKGRVQHWFGELECEVRLDAGMREETGCDTDWCRTGDHVLRS